MADVQLPQVFKLFPSPVLAEPWPDAAKFNAQLRASVLARREGSSGASRSDPAGWRSDLLMLEWGGEAARQLADYVARRCDSVTYDDRADGKRRFRWSPEMWADMSAAGAYRPMLAHPGAFWSALYHVDDGYAGSHDKALGGELTFLDPRFPLVRMRTPDLRYRRLDGSLDHHELSMRPQTGIIVIFPGWLQHAVRPYSGASNRISIGINMRTRLVEPAAQ